MVTRKRRGLPSAKPGAAVPARPARPVAITDIARDAPSDPASAMTRGNPPGSSRRRKKPFVL